MSFETTPASTVIGPRTAQPVIGTALPVPEQLRPERQGLPTESVSVLLLVGVIVAIPLLLAYFIVADSEARVVAATMGAIALIVILARPFWGLLFFTALIYIRPEDRYPELAALRLNLIIAFVTLLGLSLKMLLHRQELQKTPVMWLTLGWCVWTVAMTIPSNTPISQAAQDLARIAVLVILILNLVRTADGFRAYSTVILLLTVYLAAWSIYLYNQGIALEHEGVGLRAEGSGIFADPNDLGCTVVPGIPLALARFWRGSLWERLYTSPMVVVMCWAILLTNSRGAMVALLFAVGGFFFVSMKRKALAATLAVTMVGLLMVIAPSRMTTFDSDDPSANQRFWFWSNGFNMLKNSPQGLGYMNFRDFNDKNRAAHNSYVLAFTEMGIPGYCAWIGCLYYCYRRRRPGELWEPLRQDSEWQLLTARLALGGYLVGSFFLDHTYILVLYLLMGLPLLAQMTLFRVHDPPPESREPWTADAKRIVGLGLGSIVFIKVMADRLK